MKTTSLHLKIEMKGSVKPSKIYELLSDAKQSIVYKSILETINKDYFKLPYEVQKLSKKARRNIILNK
jgi:hypothetical protein